MLQKCSRESALSPAQVLEWHTAFSNDREVIENLPLTSHTCTSVNNIGKVKERVLENNRGFAKDLNIS